MSIIHELIAAAADPIVTKIKNGRLLPSAIGAAIGASVGASAGFVSPYLILPAALAGGLIGVTIAAGMFPRPVKPLLAGATAGRPNSPGELKHAWTAFNDLVPCATLLYERAVFIVLPTDKRQWASIQDRLSKGLDPGIPASRLIWLDEIDHIEIAKRGDKTISLAWITDGQTKRFSAILPSLDAREEFLTALETHFGTKFAAEERELDLYRATIVPWIASTMILILLASLALLSAYWRVHPPAPPVGAVEHDWFVKGVLYLGPSGFILIGAVPFAVAVIWLFKRTLQRPRVQVLRVPKRRSIGVG